MRSGVGPSTIGSEGMHASNRRKFNLAQRFPWLTRLILSAAFSPLRGDPTRLPTQLSKIWQQMPESDRKVLEDPVFSKDIIDNTRDAIARQVTGWVEEEVLMAAPWKFKLEEIHCSKVFLWHGALNKNVPLTMGKAVADHLDPCQSHFLEAEGHLSLLYNHGNEILDTLVKNAFKV
ncbi:MAG: hypothetical protein NTZ74_04115 [Chloroflexi bacterium]|nr:hypothetical protein [Chloroflexota bacterium]